MRSLSKMIWKTLFVVAFTIVISSALPNHQATESRGNNGAQSKEKVFADYKQCIGKAIDTKSLTKEILEATSNDSVKEVAKKYCGKSSAAKVCVHDLLAGISLSEDSSVKSKYEEASKAFDDAVDYICYNDGSRVASFIADEGFKCLQNNSIAFNDCVTVPYENFSPTTSFESFTSKEGCEQFAKLQSCTASTLRGCQAETAANIGETLLGYLRKARLCTV